MFGAPSIVPKVGPELLCLPRFQLWTSCRGLNYRPGARAVSRVFATPLLAEGTQAPEKISTTNSRPLDSLSLGIR